MRESVPERDKHTQFVGEKESPCQREREREESPMHRRTQWFVGRPFNVVLFNVSISYINVYSVTGYTETIREVPSINHRHCYSILPLDNLPEERDGG